MLVRTAFAILVANSVVQPARAQCVGAWLGDYAFSEQGGSINSMHVLPGGQLIVGGSFAQNSAALTCRNVARFDGESWQPLGPGVHSASGYSFVSDIAVTPSGDIVVVGQFNRAGSLHVNNVARWDGTGWHAVGTGLSMTAYPPEVTAVVALPSGDIIVAGTFDRAGDVSVNNIARWDGTTWQRVGNGVNAQYYAKVNTLELLSNGDLIVGGSFQYAGLVLADNIARWDGQSWHAIGAGTDHHVNDVVELADGSLLAACAQVPASIGPPRVVIRWDGISWSHFENATTDVSSAARVAALPNGNVVIAGHGVGGAMLWDGTEWLTILSDTDIRELAVLENGELLAGGAGEIGNDAVRKIGHFRRYTEPAICEQPTDKATCLGGPASLRVTAGGIAPLTFRWQRNGIDLVETPGRFVGTRTAQLTIDSTSFDDESDEYHCVVLNHLGTVSSATAHVRICVGELNCAGSVGIRDLAILLANFSAGTPVTYFDGDLNLDGTVDLADLASLLRNFGSDCD